MRAIPLLLIVLMLVAWPTHASSTSVQISEILVAPGNGFDREFVELYNPSSSPVAVTDWTLEDEAGNRLVFSNHTLPPHGRLVVWNGGSDTDGGIIWSRTSVWNNGGDTARLLDADGILVAQLSYGASEGAVDAAPPAGASLQFDGAAWNTDTPTPGAAPGAATGTVSVVVENVPPTPSFDGTPSWVVPGGQLAVSLSAEDPNGDAVIAWRLRDETGTLAQGAELPAQHSASAPSTPGVWVLMVDVSDEAGATGTATVHVAVRDGPLVVTFPANGTVRFPPIVPGGTDVMATAPFILENIGDETLHPIFDASPLRGPQEVQIAGRLQLGWVQAGATEWLLYDGPVMPMPALEPGGRAEIWLRFPELPSPLAAGAYGMSFTVVA